MAHLAPHEDNPAFLTVVDGDIAEKKQQLHFVKDTGNQRCFDCWFNWLDVSLCHKAKCNSQDRTDGLVGHWEEML